jgi:hypothetical protein
MNDTEFWKEWKKYEKRLKSKAPRCTCGPTGEKRLSHFGRCPYLSWWNKVFTEFEKSWKKPKTLEEWYKT